MKKVLSLILALVMCLSLCACGGGSDNNKDNTNNTSKNPETTTMSKDDMLSAATAVCSDQIDNDTFENKAKATQLYCNKVLKVTGFVVSIEEDHIKLGDDFYAGVTVIDVYLPIEDLAMLEKGQLVTIVGQTADKIETRNQNMAGSDWEQEYFTMPQAYFVGDVYETTMSVTVTIGASAKLDQNVKDAFELSDILVPIGLDLSTFKESCEVTVKGKIKHNSQKDCNEMTEITVVE